MNDKKPQENVVAYIGRTIADEFKKVHIIPKTILITLITTATITYFLLPVVANTGAEFFIDRVNNPTQEELKRAALIQFKKDSLAKVKNDSLQVVLSKINMRHREQIVFKTFQLEKQLKNAVAVNYWSIHNGGETLDVDGRWYLEVYISSRQSNEEDFRNPPPIYPGFRWLGRKTEEVGFLYIEDVRKYPDLYIGKAKTQLDLGGVKSFVCIFLKNRVGKERLFASIDFSVYNGLEENPNLFFEVSNLKRFILQRIN